MLYELKIALNDDHEDDEANCIFLSLVLAQGIQLSVAREVLLMFISCVEVPPAPGI